jgi:hypothetical protein
MTPSRYPEGSEPENCELVEEIALMRTTVVARTVRSVRENVGGGWGEIDRDVMTDYQKKRLGCDPVPCSEDLLRRALKERVLTAVRRWKRLTAVVERAGRD